MAGKPAGAYPIVPSGLSATNYDITYVKGTLTVTLSPKVNVTYSAHVQDYGDQQPVTNGAESGTTGQSKRLEAVRANVDQGTIEYRSHVQNEGWEDGWAKNGADSGTVGQARRIEAIQMRYSGVDDQHVWYRVHSQDYGWLGWTCDGEAAGTTGFSRRDEAIDVQVLPKGQVPAGYDGSVACVAR